MTIKDCQNRRVLNNAHFFLQFKESLSKELSVEIGSLCLIFAGRILKDAETLKFYGTARVNQIGQFSCLVFVGIKDGVTVHLVVKSTGKVAASAANKTASPTATPNAVSDNG